MKDFFQQIYNNLKKLSMAQKVSIALVVVIVFVVAMFLVIFRSDAEMVILFPNLSINESAEIAKKISEFGFKYKIKNEKLYVSSSEKDKIKFSLAQNDSLPQKSEGFADVFKNRGIFSQTKAVERITIIRGLQGELERTIMDIKGITAARVHIAMPEEKAFSDDENPVTASVMVKLGPLARLNRKQILGIINIVSFSVEGLKPSNVKIVDFMGNTLSDDVAIEGSETSFNGRRMEIQKKYEYRLEKKV